MQTSLFFDWRTCDINRKEAFRKSLLILQNEASRSKIMHELPAQFELSLFVHIFHKIIFNYDLMLFLLSEGPSIHSVLRIDDDHFIILF